MGRGTKKFNKKIKTKANKTLKSRLPAATQNDSYYLYKLFDPRDKSKKTRYIGITKNPYSRLNAHKNNPVPAIKDWVENLKRSGVKPDMEIISNGALPSGDAALEEIKLIKQLKSSPNSGLLNRNPGGALGGSEIKWTKETASKAVLLISNNGVYPSYKDFRKQSLLGLEKSIYTRLGGHEEMAKETNLKYEPYYKWKTYEQRKEGVLDLIKYLKMTDYPEQKQFLENRKGGLYKAIYAAEGHKQMCEDLGFIWKRSDWSDEDAQVNAIKKIVSDLNLNSYPTQKQFNEEGKGGLYNYLSKNKLHKQRAKDVGVFIDNKYLSKWETKEKRIAGVKSLMNKLKLKDRYPVQNEFHNNGFGGLYNSIRKSEGHYLLAKELGFKHRKTDWSKEDCLAGVKELMEKLSISVYPTQKQFKENNMEALLAAIDRSKDFDRKDIIESLGLEYKAPVVWPTDLKSQVKIVSELINDLGLKEYPKKKQFAENGLAAFYQKVNKTPWKHAGIKKELNLI